jgi:PKD repeat protein
LELAVFVQNNLTREILQGYKVRLAFLMPPPPPLVAGFSSNISNVCAGGAVQFEDLSTGNPDEWFWEFPGGTPDTSWEQNPLIVYDVPGKYDVSLTIIKAEDTNYVVMEDYITVSEIPTVSFDPIDYQCLNYPAFELTQGYPEGGTYSGPGVEDNMFDPFLAGIGEHTLLYTYADTNDCENSAEQSVIVDACTGIPEQEANITALPNPTKGTFQLTFSGIRNSISYKVMNSAGIVIEEKTDLNVDGGLSTIIDLSGYPNGIHYVLIENNGETYFRKVILNK